MQTQTLLRKPIAAAVLSAIVPGLGQAAAGQPRRGLIVAIPTFGFLGAVLVILVFFRHQLLDSAFDTSWLTSLMVFIFIHMLYRVWAVVDAYLLAGRELGKEQRRRRSSNRKTAPVIGLAAILVLIVGVHGALASVDMSWQNGVSCLQALTPCFAQTTLAPGQTISLDTSNPGVVLDPSGSGAIAQGSDSGPAPSIGPVGTLDLNGLPTFGTTDVSKNWREDGQFNVLLLGVDYEPTSAGRSSGLRPDTMIVLHLDIASGRAALISIPRGTQCVPLPSAIGQHYNAQDDKIGCPHGTWPYMLNWLAGEAGWGLVTGSSAVKNFPFFQDATAGQVNDPMAFPRAIEATSEAISTLTKLTIDGYVMINIQGLTQLIDKLGGIDITVPSKITDYPCGPSGQWESKWRICDLNKPTTSNPNPAMSSRVHDGYQVPVGELDEMKADAAKSGGKQSISWQSSTNPVDGTDIAFVIQPGLQHMDGPWAVAYARSRIYYTDWDRNLRQQLVLKSLRSTAEPCKVLANNIGNLGGFISSLSMFDTNLPLTDVSQWAGLAQRVLGGSVQSFNLDPTTLGTPKTTFINQTTLNKAWSIVAHSLDAAPSASSSSGGGGGGGLSC